MVYRENENGGTVDGEVISETHIVSRGIPEEEGTATIRVLGRKKREVTVDSRKPFIQTIAKEAQAEKFKEINVRFIEPGTNLPTVINLQDAPVTFKPGVIYEISPYVEPGVA